MSDAPNSDNRLEDAIERVRRIRAAASKDPRYDFISEQTTRADLFALVDEIDRLRAELAGRPVLIPVARAAGRELRTSADRAPVRTGRAEATPAGTAPSPARPQVKK